MKAIQLDVSSIEYEPIEPEIGVHDNAEQKTTTIKDALVFLVALERGDTEAYASKAVKELVDFAAKQKIGNLVIYPFAHLSSNLEEPQRAMNLLDYMIKEAQKSKLKVYRAPFGWNKRLAFSAKGHPLAEMFKSYGDEKKETAKKHERKVDTSIVRKSDFVGLPDTDHRIIGERLNLFSFQEVSPGMVYWHRNGLILYNQLTGLMRELLKKYGYEEISTPTLANLALWHVSGHIDHYKENMFVFESESEQMGMKPMNCPSSILVYKSRKWSYRELPFRTSTFDRLYRNEISGALTGLFRVREMTQDDGHIFVREDQVEQELSNTLKLILEVYSIFGMKVKFKLSTMPDTHMGEEKVWEKATTYLKNALESNKIKYVLKEKEGAFYGPKIDFDVTDSMGRDWQCATLQVDYQEPARFRLSYTGEDGQEHPPVIIHRAVLGSLERFAGVMIEHYQGKFPTWLAPVQVRILTISEHANEYAYEVYEALKKEGIRVDADASDKTLDYKVRAAQVEKIPYMIVLGKKEMEGKKISVRSRSGKSKMGMTLQELIKLLNEEISSRKNELAF